jgi:toxin ParE1/3/4
MKKFIIAPTASQDLNKIADYFLTVNVIAGEKLFQLFNQKIKQLTQFPLMGRSYNHIKPSLRGLPLKGYIIFYRVSDDQIEILRIVNGHQNLSDLF